MLASDPRILTDEPAVKLALAEIEEAISALFPEAVIEVGPSYDPWGVYVRVTADVEDPDEVTDAIGDRLLDIQVERRLPIWVVAVCPIEREIADLDARSRPAPARASTR